ncbi:MAG: L,D-transpeptidase/peptidoglycan binding protein [Lachnospiraceae bacterium]|nr:L,D-transpeptidase/peptidoglycan binding protein [Lachnospiraceae bacterium]
MKKVILIVLSLLILIPLVGAAAGYGYMAYHYRDIYMPGLAVNNVYAADLTVDQLNDKLKENLEYPKVVVTDKNGKELKFSMEEADYDENYNEDLETIKDGQNVEELVRHLVDKNAKVDSRDIFPVITYDEEKLGDFLDQQNFLKDDSDVKGKAIEVRYNRAVGYFLYDETTNMLNHEKAKEKILSEIRDGNYEIELKEDECYDTPKTFSPDQRKARELWEKLKPYMETKINYDFGGRKTIINGAVISNWIMKDEEDDSFLMSEHNTLQIDEKAVEDYMKDLCDQYSTVGKPRTFKATRGDVITINKGIYGSKVDYKKELEFVTGQLGGGREVDRRAEYSQKPFSNITGPDDIGRTYIEVDMTNQHLYYYQNGRLALDTDVVTGNTSLGHGTPERVAYIQCKQRDRILRGPDYESFVHYWMQVYNGIGIHDANWRGKFGGTIYKHSGSHGCVNTPIAKVKELYSMVEEGTPVLLFY